MPTLTAPETLAFVEWRWQVPAKPLDVDLLAAALPQAERTDLSGATHMLKPDVPGEPFATYTDPTQPLHPGLVPAVAGFLNRNPPR